MPSGRKKEKAPKIQKISVPEIKAPPTITRYDLVTPTGDRFETRVDGDRYLSQSFLTPGTSALVKESQTGLSSLAGELNAPDPRRLAEIQQRARDFYDLQAEVINTESNDILSRTESNLAKRFGGAYGSTFGNDLLSRIEKDRLGQLSVAGKEASLLAEDLYTQDEHSRIQRMGVFQNILNNLFEQEQRAAGIASPILANEQQRASDLAVMRAQMLQSVAQANLATQLSSMDQRRNSRSSTLTNLIPMVAGFAAAPFTGGASLVSGIGGSAALFASGR